MFANCKFYIDISLACLKSTVKGSVIFGRLVIILRSKQKDPLQCELLMTFIK